MDPIIHFEGSENRHQGGLRIGVGFLLSVRVNSLTCIGTLAVPVSPTGLDQWPCPGSHSCMAVLAFQVTFSAVKRLGP